MATESPRPRTPQTQAWLRTIYDRPSEFLGQTVAILNDEEIVLVAPTFRAARDQCIHKLSVPFGVQAPASARQHGFPLP